MNKEILFYLEKVANSLAAIQLAIINRPQDISEELRNQILDQVKKAHIAKECALSVLQGTERLKELGDLNEHGN